MPMKLFDEQTARNICRKNKKTAMSLAAATAAGTILCVLCLWLGEPRLLWQLAATLITGVLGCFWLMQLQTLGWRKRVLALCQKIQKQEPVNVQTVLVREGLCTTTLAGLPFYEARAGAQADAPGFWLYAKLPWEEYLDKPVLLTAAGRIVIGIEVVL